MTSDEQIDHIVKLMLEGEWKGARSHRELAAAWGCHPRTVSYRANEAAAVCRRMGGDVESLVRAKLAELEQIADAAMNHKRPIVVAGLVELHPAPDFKAAAKATRDYLEVLGAFNHVKKTQDVPGDEVGKMTPAEKLEAHRKAVAELEQEIAGTKGDMH
jgi:hypothetical protein